MKFLAIDIETTGLDDKLHSITEFAAVFADLEGKEEPITFYRYIQPEDFVWSMYCLNLHWNWLHRALVRVKEKLWDCPNEPRMVKDVYELIREFCVWLFNDCNWPIPVEERWKSIIPAGKNFFSFDHRFLEAAGFPRMFKRRQLDPTILYTRQDDTEPPDLTECKARAIAEGCDLKPGVAHNALDDAMDVVKLLQHRFKQ